MAVWPGIYEHFTFYGLGSTIGQPTQEERSDIYLMLKRQPGTMIAGITLLSAGLLLITGQLGLPWLSFARLWPLLVTLLGAALLSQVARHATEAPGQVWVGVVALLGGLFLLVFSLQLGDLTWASLSECWPGFLLIVGLAFMVIFLLSDMRDEELLIPAYLFGGLGLLALPFTLGVIRSPVFSQVIRLWPLAILLVGLAIFLRIRQREQNGPRPE